MQAPLIVFDHIGKTAGLVAMGPVADKRLDAVLAAQQKQVATSGRPTTA